MKVGCLQFAPQLGDPDTNFRRADEILSETSETASLDLLVLPELAFTGYNFPSLAAITPFLEPTASGPSTKWAIRTAVRLSCVVHVGYPEITTSQPPKRYNSTVTVSPTGEILAHYRKAFLYYTDDRWALEGDAGFFIGELPGISDCPGSKFSKVAMGICMDINPYKFLAPWSAYEFANHVVTGGVSLVVLSMAWLSTALGVQDEVVERARMLLQLVPEEPDSHTLQYWAERFRPIQEFMPCKDVTLIIANRTGHEDDAVYAGSSNVMHIHDGAIEIYDMLGRGEERCLIVNTDESPKFTFGRSEDEDEVEADNGMIEEEIHGIPTENSLDSMSKP